MFLSGVANDIDHQNAQTKIRDAQIELNSSKKDFILKSKNLKDLQTLDTTSIENAEKLIDAHAEKTEAIKEEAVATQKLIDLQTEAANATLKLLDLKNRQIEQAPTILENMGEQTVAQEDEMTAVEELAHQHQFLADTIQSGDESKMITIALGKVMAASWASQKEKLGELTEGHVNSAMAIGAAQMHVGQAAADSAGAFIVAQTQMAIASFIADSFKKFGILGGIIGAGAAGVVGSLMSQGIQSITAAEGMDEIVTEPTLILAGEEGAEYVNIEPTQNEGAGMGGGGQIIFQGNVLSKDFIEDEAIPMIRDALRRGHSLA